MAGIIGRFFYFSPGENLEFAVNLYGFASIIFSISHDLARSRFCELQDMNVFPTRLIGHVIPAHRLDQNAICIMIFSDGLNHQATCRLAPAICKMERAYCLLAFFALGRISAAALWH